MIQVESMIPSAYACPEYLKFKAQDMDVDEGEVRKQKKKKGRKGTKNPVDSK